MFNTSNLSVDFRARTITVSQNFLRRSKQVDTPEYHTLLRMMKELPGFELTTRHAAKPSKAPYMPSYEEMLAQIRMTTGSPAEALQEFERIREFARNSGKGYMMVRAWFLGHFNPDPAIEIA